MLPIDEFITPQPLVQLAEVLVATLLICVVAPIDLKFGDESRTAVVPISLQSLAVLAVPSFLGTWRGSVAILCYLLLGFSGLPVFAQGSSGIDKLWGPTSGFLLSFLLAGSWLGWNTEQNNHLHSLGTFLVRFWLGHMIILALGFLWLGVHRKKFLDLPKMVVHLLPGLFFKTLLGAVVASKGNQWLLNETKAI
jgi:biotin transporter BioY